MTLRDLLIRHEGLVLHAYQDSLGYWTIGVGHLIDKRRGGAIPVEIAMLLLDLDIAKHTAEARQFPWFDTLTPARQDVVVDMLFNLGLEGFKKFKNMIVALEVGNYGDAAAEMLESRWAEQVGDRAIELSEVMFRGKYSNQEGHS